MQLQILQFFSSMQKSCIKTENFTSVLSLGTYFQPSALLFLFPTAAVISWLRHYAVIRKVAGSIPDWVIDVIH